MLLYALISYLRLRHKVHASVRIEKGVYVCDDISDPFILGLIRPRICLPSGMDETTKGYVLAHERAHLKRFDHIWKPLGFLLLAVYWFNPLLWLAYILLCRDIELACDEKVVKELDDTGKAAYSEALVTASVSRRSIAACPLAFGEVGVKSRVKSVLNHKKPAFWIILVALLLGIVTAVCFLTVPKKEKSVALSSEEDVTVWFIDWDMMHHVPNGPASVKISAFPGVTFRWVTFRWEDENWVDSVQAVENGSTRTLFSGMPICNVFFADMTGDGKPELCASVSFGSGIVDYHIVVYDYVNRQSYTLWDRGAFDYHLSMVDGVLTVHKKQYNNSSISSIMPVLDTGTLMMHDGVLCCRWSDGSVSVLNRELHETELYGEWLVEKETDNSGNELYAFGALAPWKEYNFKEDGTVIYNETVPYSSDSELAFGHPVEYSYAVYDSRVHIEDGRSCWGYYDPRTRTLELSYQTSPNQFVYATLRRMGEDAPVAEKTYVGEWELVKIVDGRQEYDLAFLTAASGLENNRVILRADGTGNYLLEITGSESEDIGLTYTAADDENTVTVRFAEEMAYGYTMIAKYDPDSDTLSMYYPDDPTMYSVYCRAGSIQDDPAAELTIEMLIGKWVTEGNIMYDRPFLPGTLTFLEDGSASLWLDGYLRSGEALDFQTALTGNMVCFSGYLSGNTFASYDAKTDTLRLRLPLASAGTLVFTRDRSAEAPQTLEEILLGTYVCTGAKQNELNIPVPAEYVGMTIDLGDTSGAESYRHVASVTVGGTKKEGYDWKVDENDILIVWNPETGDNLQFEWFPKQTACTTLKLTIGQENPITLFFTFDD